MFRTERRVVEFIGRHCLLVTALGVSLLALWLRLLNLDFRSSDYNSFLLPWFEQLRQGGGLRALAYPIGNYNVPYLTILALLTYLPVEPLYSIKAVSILFDYVAAAAAGVCVWKLAGKKGRARLAGVLVYSAVLILPTVVINSAYWAQCDTIYTAFLLLSLCALADERYIWAFVWFSVSFCFKLQAILFLPVLVLLYLVRRKFSALHFLLIPAALLLGDLPALLAGRGVRETLTIYLRQADEYPALTLNYPNLYYFLMGDYELFAGLGVAAAAILLLLMAAYLLWHRWDIPAGELPALALWCALVCLYFLPSMHERYGLLTDILAVMWFARRKKRAWLAVLVNLSSLLSYTGFLFHYWVMDLVWFAVAKLFLLVVLTGDLLADLRAANPFELELDEGEPE